MISVRFNLKRALIGVLCACTLISVVYCTPLSAPVEASASEVDDYKSQLAQLEQQQKELEKEIAALKGDKADQNKIKAAIQKKINNTQSQINACNRQIESLDSAIADNERNISEKNAELEELKYLFRQRLRTVAMNGGEVNSSLLVLLNADGLEDLLTKSELTKAITAYDNTLSNKILGEMRSIEKSKSDIEKLKEEQKGAKETLAQKRAELDAQIKEVNSTLGGINSSINKAEDKLDALEKAEKELEDAINSALNGNNNQRYDGDFAWPCPGYYNVGSPYGYRIHPIYGKRKFHKGIDIGGSGIKGKPIIAAADGIVSLAKYNSGGYGYYVVLDHGKGDNGKYYATLYAHMTKYIVSSGQYVKKGQTIGYVGTTGASTGYHLHFEIRVGSRNNSNKLAYDTVNPMSYF